MHRGCQLRRLRGTGRRDAGIRRLPLCGIGRGVADLQRFLQWEGAGRHYDRIALRYWDRFLGVSGANDPRLDSISPIKHIDAVTVPVLLIHGRDDTVVPFEQSTVMFDALRKVNKKVDLISLKNEDQLLAFAQRNATSDVEVHGRFSASP